MKRILIIRLALLIVCALSFDVAFAQDVRQKPVVKKQTTTTSKQTTSTPKKQNKGVAKKNTVSSTNKQTTASTKKLVAAQTRTSPRTAPNENGKLDLLTR